MTAYPNEVIADPMTFDHVSIDGTVEPRMVEGTIHAMLGTLQLATADYSYFATPTPVAEVVEFAGRYFAGLVTRRTDDDKVFIEVTILAGPSKDAPPRLLPEKDMKKLKLVVVRCGDNVALYMDGEQVVSGDEWLGAEDRIAGFLHGLATMGWDRRYKEWTVEEVTEWPEYLDELDEENASKRVMNWGD